MSLPTSPSLSKKVHKVQEALVFRAAHTIHPGEKIHLLPPVHAGDLRPDVVVGSPLRPRVVYLVTHGGAQNARQMKAWRDTYELAFYRTSLPRTRVVRVYFGTRNRDGWEDVFDAFFDGVARIPRTEGLMRAEAELSRLPMDDVVARLTDGPLVDGVVDALRRTAGRASRRLVLPMDGREAAPFVPSFLRRGLVVAAMMDDPGCTRALRWAGVLGDGLFGPVLDEPYDTWLADFMALEPSLRSTLLSHARPCLADDLRACASVPSSLSWLRQGGTVPERLSAVRLVLKAGSLHSFGNAALLRMAGLEPDTSRLYVMSRVFSGQASAPQWLVDALPSLEREALALVGERGEQAVGRGMIRALVFDGAIKRRCLDPLGVLVKQIVPGGTNHPRHPTLLDPVGRVATTRVYVHSGCAIHWRTAHMGKHDKAKELAARGAALRPHFRRLVLVLDGEWGQVELRLLHQGGWTTLPWSELRLLPSLCR